MIFYWGKLDSTIGPIYLGASHKGLAYCDISQEGVSSLQHWQLINLPDHILKKGENNIIKEAKKQLLDYFSKKGKKFDLPIELLGTPFQNKVWQALTTIPYGETRTYGQIAAFIGKPKAARAVGGANNRNPIALFVPWHRVIGAGGALVGFGGGLALKQWLLDLEGANYKIKA